NSLNHFLGNWLVVVDRRLPFRHILHAADELIIEVFITASAKDFEVCGNTISIHDEFNLYITLVYSIRQKFHHLLSKIFEEGPEGISPALVFGPLMDCIFKLSNLAVTVNHWNALFRRCEFETLAARSIDEVFTTVVDHHHRQLLVFFKIVERE